MPDAFEAGQHGGVAFRDDAEILLPAKARKLNGKYDPSRLDEVRNYCLMGATNERLAEFLGVSVSAVSSWLTVHPEFRLAVCRGRELANAAVARSLFRRAVGFRKCEEKVFMHNGVPVRVNVMKYYPPDTSAAIFWLTNREGADWSLRQEHTGANGGPVKIHLTAGDDKL